VIGAKQKELTIMRNEYKYFYDWPQAPAYIGNVGYSDPVQSEGECRAIASRLAKQQAALRRSKAAERWVVFTAASLIAFLMLPVLIVIGALIAARAQWRRWNQHRGRQRDAVVSDDARSHEQIRRRRAANRVAVVRATEIVGPRCNAWPCDEYAMEGSLS
jgi:hypothetical protein